MAVFVFGPAFKREYRRLVKKRPELKTKIRRRIKLLLDNPLHPSLRLHKVFSPKVGEVFSFSVERDIRILFRWQGEAVIFYRIGSHDQIY